MSAVAIRNKIDAYESVLDVIRENIENCKKALVLFDKMPYFKESIKVEIGRLEARGKDYEKNIESCVIVLEKFAEVENAAKKLTEVEN